MIPAADVAGLAAASDLAALGREMHGLIGGLYPICRSITGDGLRRTLAMLRQVAPLEVQEVPTGTPALDWTVPKEWNIRDAWIADASGRRVVDFRASNLHVVNYSVAVRRRMSLAELRPRLHTLPERPDWIPYRTSYYEENWGFCLAHHDLEQLPEGEYEVVIESTLAEGSLSYGELFLPGETSDEVLLSAHACHPSLANDNLSGLVLIAVLARTLATVTRRRYSYRFLFVPGTIGSIAWLSRNAEAVSRIRHGLVAACVGDAGPLQYKRTRRGNAEIDRAAEHVLRHSAPSQIRDFSPYGYDERQYGSPGFDLAVGSLTRTPHGRYPEYHTSADDLAFVRPESLADSLRAYLAVLTVLEGNARYRNVCPFGEPQLGRRGLYGSMGGYPDPGMLQMAMLWVLNQSDGGATLLEIADKSGLPFDAVRDAADRLVEHGLLVALP